LDIAVDAIEPTSGFISHDDPNTIDARSLLQDSGVISAGSLPRLRDAPSSCQTRCGIGQAVAPRFGTRRVRP